MALHLPTVQDVRELLEGLVGRSLSVAPGAPLAPGPRNPVSLGSYIDDQNQPQAVACVDLPLGVRLGAALSLVPAPSADQAIEEGRLDGDLPEVLDEVLNVLAATFNAPGATHLRLDRTYHPPEALPPTLLMRAMTLGRRLDLTAEVSGYGPGRISVVLPVG